MKAVSRSIAFFLILLPVLLAGLFTLSPEPHALLSAAHAITNLQQGGNRTGEITAIQKVLTYQPWRQDLWEEQADLQFGLGNYRDALDTYQKASSVGKIKPTSLLNMGKAYYALGDTENAQNYYRQASKAGSTDVQFYLELAKKQEEINDSLGTQTTLLYAYGLDPLDTGINYQLGVQLAASQPENAIKFLQFAEKEQQYSVFAQAMLKTISDSQSMGAGADRFIYIGQELSQIGEWQAAVIAFTQATQSDPANGIAWALLGEAVQHVGKSGYAQLSKALALDPHSDIVNGLMAVYFRRQKNYDMAISYLNKAMENNPNEATWQIEVGNTLALQGDLANALIHLQVATMMDPESWVPWESLANFSISYNYYVSSVGLDAARKALLLVPGSPVLLDIMGNGYFVIGDLANAEKYYLQALNEAPKQGEILLHLGQLYLQKGDKDKAVLYLQAAAENTSDSRIRDYANLMIQQMNGN